MYKNLNLASAKKLIFDLLDDSDFDTRENFWLREFETIVIASGNPTYNDISTYQRILDLKNSSSEEDKKMYYNCIVGAVLDARIKKNWRKFLNGNILEKHKTFVDSLDDST